VNIEAVRRFEKWKEELEEKLARHLFTHPEKQSIAIVAKPRIVVQESTRTKGSWAVSSDGITTEFDGPLAHLNATKHANKLANTQCTICGGRLAHRAECLDAPKDGPTLLGS
jgi:hypothetical protein